MTIHKDLPQDPNIHQPEVKSTGLRLVNNIIQQVIRLVTLTEQERIEAGIDLGHRHI